MDLEETQSVLTELKNCDVKEVFRVQDVFNALDAESVLVSTVEIIGEFLKCLMEKVSNNENGEHSQYHTWVYQTFEDGKTKVKAIAEDGTKVEELRKKSFEVLLSLLPSYIAFLGGKPIFPSKEYSELLEIIIMTLGDSTCFDDVLKEYMIFEDIRVNFWKALDIAVRKIKLEPVHVQNILNLIGNVITKLDKHNQDEMGPIQYYCKVKIGILHDKELGKHVHSIWGRLSAVDVPNNTRELLLCTLLEKLLHRMDKPIFLTDYFMNSLQYGGSISILALQGIFTLIQKYNINYPNVYDKLYGMLTPGIFGMNYKARLIFLTDVFLSSLHLPETMVAGFAKRLARLCLIAPPADIVVLLSLITNLIIRHSGLHQLISNMGKHHYDNDPFIATENDPSASMALSSSLWEVKLLQNHVIPNVSSAAMFIDTPLPSVERDLSALLETDSAQIFSREIKKKMKEPPISFEKPKLSNIKAFTLWNFKN